MEIDASQSSKMKYNNYYRKRVTKTVDNKAFRKDCLDGMTARQWVAYAKKLNDANSRGELKKNACPVPGKIHQGGRAHERKSHSATADKIKPSGSFMIHRRDGSWSNFVFHNHRDRSKWSIYQIMADNVWFVAPKK